MRDYLKPYHGANKLQRIANWQQISVASPKPVRIILYYSMILSEFAHASYANALEAKQVWEHNKKDMNNIWTSEYDTISENMKINEKWLMHTSLGCGKLMALMEENLSQLIRWCLVFNACLCLSKGWDVSNLSLSLKSMTNMTNEWPGPSLSLTISQLTCI